MQPAWLVPIYCMAMCGAECTEAGTSAAVCRHQPPLQGSNASIQPAVTTHVLADKASLVIMLGRACRC